MPRTRNPFIGYWKITRVDEWDLAYIDLVVPGFLEFEVEDERLDTPPDYSFVVVCGESLSGSTVELLGPTASDRRF